MGDAGIEHLRFCVRHGTMTRHVTRGDGGLRCQPCRSAAVSDRRRRVKLILIGEAGGSCILCGYARSPAALTFHHLDPTTKSFSISGQGIARSLDRAREEARKCVLLCANCHAEVEVGFAQLPPPMSPDPG